MPAGRFERLRPLLVMKIFGFILPCALVFTAACSAGRPELSASRDVYRDFYALKADNTEGLDYSREVYYRGSPVTVFAVHGGDIEPETARVARRVAGRNFNLYIFNGWGGKNSSRLHVTAAHFDDPLAVRLATSSVLGVALHEQADRGSRVCVGGSNKAAAELMAARLEAAGFSAEAPCGSLPGVSAANIVNRTSAGGVQLEMTRRLLERLGRNEADLSRFSEAVRSAALEAAVRAK